MVYRTGDNNFGTAKWIVDPTAGQGTHTTIATALTSSASGDTIFIRPGTYTENLTLKAGVNLVSYTADSLTPNVTIVGKATFTAAGTVSISGIRLQTNSDFALAVTGSSASIVNLINCYVNCPNNTGISFTTSSSSAQINLTNTNGNLGTTGIALYSMSSTGLLNITYGSISNSGASSTASSNSAGVVQVLYCIMSIPFSTSSSGVLIIEFTDVNTTPTNTSCVVTAGTGSVSIESCTLSSGSASALSIGTGTSGNLIGCPTISSTNTNTITGAGTLNYGMITFTNSSSGINTTTLAPYPVASPKTYTSTAIQTFTGNGTYTPTAGMLYCIIRMVGGGAAGGGSASEAAGLSGGAGGGSGEYAEGIFTAATIGASQSVTIGAAGTGNSAGTGGNGGNTSVGALISANGGTGGAVVSVTTSTYQSTAGGAGGTGGSGGSFRFNGTPGGYTQVQGGSNWGASGAGGTGPFSGGASAVVIATSASSQATNGNAATGYGGGGSGAFTYVTAAARTGGNGSAGLVVITEFI